MNNKEEVVVKFMRQKDYVMVNDNLGNGAFGRTVLLRDTMIEELFVAKKYEPIQVIQNDTKLKAQFLTNFLEEIKILHKLNHKNIVRVYNYYAYENAQTAFIIMEYVSGTSIDKYMADVEVTTEQLDNIFIQLIDGFHYIESHGIIHRDIRESNILIDDKGIPKIIDFGIGKIIDESEEIKDSLRSDINRLGLHLLPQEYYDGIYTSKTDMFYLGELFYRLLQNNKHIKINEFSYNDVLEKMMKKNPTERYKSFGEIREVMNELNFESIEVSYEDKEIYQNFSDALYQALNAFVNEKKFITDTGVFIANLERVKRDNIFENSVQNSSDLVGTIVVEPYKNNNIFISVDIIDRFIKWFKSADKNTQKLILNNIILKLSIKEIDYWGELELPF